jgi:hypothetical protein
MTQGLAKLGHEIGSVVNLAAMANLQDKHQQAIVLDLTNHAPIADAVAPKAAKLTNQSVTATARVFKRRNFVQQLDDLACIIPVQLAELFFCPCVELNRPCQSGVSLLQS